MDLEWTWNGPGMDLEWTRNGPGMDLDLDLSLTIIDKLLSLYVIKVLIK